MKLTSVVAVCLTITLSGCATYSDDPDSEGMGIGMALLAGAAMGLAAAEAPGSGADAAIFSAATASNSPSSAGQRYASGTEKVAARKSHCLRVERENVFGSTTALANSCATDLDVRWCFGTRNDGCHTAISATDVGAFSKRTIFYDKSDYANLAFISYACDSDDDACFETLNEYARNLRAKSPRI